MVCSRWCVEDRSAGSVGRGMNGDRKTCRNTPPHTYIFCTIKWGELPDLVCKLPNVVQKMLTENGHVQWKLTNISYFRGRLGGTSRKLCYWFGGLRAECYHRNGHQASPESQRSTQNNELQTKNPYGELYMVRYAINCLPCSWLNRAKANRQLTMAIPYPHRRAFPTSCSQAVNVRYQHGAFCRWCVVRVSHHQICQMQPHWELPLVIQQTTAYTVLRKNGSNWKCSAAEFNRYGCICSYSRISTSA